MADNYIEYIANGLKELHPQLSSQGFIDHFDDGFPFTLNGDNEQVNWSWDDFFTAMAWNGLKSSTNPNNEDYKIAAWEELSNRDKALYKQYQGYAPYESNKCN